MKQRLMIWMLTVWLCLIPALALADSINTQVGIAGKNSDAVTWKHLLAANFAQFSAGAFTTANNQNYLAVYALTAGCSGVNCATISGASVLAPNADGSLVGNQSLLTYAHLYAFTQVGGDRWDRLRKRTPSTAEGGGVVDGLATSPMLRSGFGPNDLSLGDTPTQAANFGIQNILTYGVGTGGALSRTYNVGFIGTSPNTCNGCQISAHYALTDPATPAFAASAGAGNQEFATTNSLNTSGLNAAVSVTLAATANRRGHVYSVEARCSAGTSNLLVSHGGTTVWNTAAAEVGVVNFQRHWSSAPLAGLVNSAVVITLAACGAGNTGTLIVQTSIF